RQKAARARADARGATIEGGRTTQLRLSSTDSTVTGSAGWNVDVYRSLSQPVPRSAEETREERSGSGGITTSALSKYVGRRAWKVCGARRCHGEVGACSTHPAKHAGTESSKTRLCWIFGSRRVRRTRGEHESCTRAIGHSAYRPECGSS